MSLLNLYFDDWYRQPAPNRLGFEYNYQAGRIGVDEAARQQAAVVHFYGMEKPWEPSPIDRGGQAAAPVPGLCDPDFQRRFRVGVEPLLERWNALAATPLARSPAPPATGPHAFATLLIHDAELAPALALKASLDRIHPRSPVLALLPPCVGGRTARTLEAAGFDVRRIPWVVAPERVGAVTAASLARLRLWHQTDFRRIVYLAPTCVVWQDVSDLFGRPGFAAAPRGQRPDRPLSQVLVLEPSTRTFAALARHARESGAATFGQCLHGFFADWYGSSPEHRLPQTDAFELECFLYLQHTELLTWLLGQEALRVLVNRPFVYDRRWTLVPSPEIEARHACRELQRTVCEGEPNAAVDPDDLVTLETRLDQEATDPSWARRLWREKWQACRRRLGIDLPDD